MLRYKNAHEKEVVKVELNYQTLDARKSPLLTRPLVAWLGSFDAPLDVLDTHFFGRLLIIVEPFAFLQIDSCEPRGRIHSFGQPFALSSLKIGPRSWVRISYVCFELRELKTSAINFDDVAGHWWRCQFIDHRRTSNRCSRLPLSTGQWTKYVSW